MRIKVFECNECDFENERLNVLKHHYKTNHCNIKIPSTKNPETEVKVEKIAEVKAEKIDQPEKILSDSSTETTDNKEKTSTKKKIMAILQDTGNENSTDDNNELTMAENLTFDPVEFASTTEPEIEQNLDENFREIDNNLDPLQIENIDHSNQLKDKNEILNGVINECLRRKVILKIQRLPEKLVKSHLLKMNSGSSSPPQQTEEEAVQPMVQQQRPSFKCDVCGKIFPAQSSLSSHVGSHKKGQARNFKCDFCDKTYTSAGFLDRHVRSCHNKEKLVKSSSAQLKCTKCDKTFSKSAELKKHIEIVCGLKCDICSHASLDSGALKRHVESVHGKTKVSHKCHNCDMAFTTTKDLNHHIYLLHTHMCHICDITYVKSSELKKHMDSVHIKAKVHQCRFCDKNFVKSSELKNHREAVHSHNAYMKKSQAPPPPSYEESVNIQKQKTHKCHTCSQSFLLASDLKKHFSTSSHLAAEMINRISKPVSIQKIHNADTIQKLQRLTPSSTNQGTGSSTNSNIKRKRDELENFRQNEIKNMKQQQQMNPTHDHHRKKQNVDNILKDKNFVNMPKNLSIIPLGGGKRKPTTNSSSSSIEDAKRAKFQNSLEQNKRKVGPTTKINQVVDID